MQQVKLPGFLSKTGALGNGRKEHQGSHCAGERGWREEVEIASTHAEQAV